MNMHVGSLPPPVPPAPRNARPRGFACCPFCGGYALRFTVDRTSVVCEAMFDGKIFARCGAIMPGEWFGA